VGVVVPTGPAVRRPGRVLRAVRGAARHVGGLSAAYRWVCRSASVAWCRDGPSQRSAMTTGAELLVDTFGRVQEAVHEAVSGLTVEQLHARLDPEANSIAWLVWHLTRVQDDHIADVAGLEQVWLRDGFEKRFGLPLDQRAIGYG